MKWLAYIICYCIYPFSFLFPRNKKKCAFGSFRGAFNDNAKYLFIYVHGQCKDKQVRWLSVNRTTVRKIRSFGLPADWVFSPRGIWFALTSKYWFVNSYTSDILFCLSGNATVVNLWHGVGLKRCEFNITNGELAKRYVEHNWREVFTHPECFRRPDYLVSSTDFQSQMFAKAFRIRTDQCLNLGYPRNTILTSSKEEILQFVKRYEPKSTGELIETMQKFDKVYIYMPTWRDSQLDVFSQNFNLTRLEEVLKEQNACLLLKPHANTRIKDIPSFGHIYFIDGKTDVYGILPFTDVLITDYSSILYDYILMEGKDVILYLYDMQEYIKDRDFYYPFDENVCGKRVYEFDSLLQTIEKQDYTLGLTERQDIINKFWGETMNKRQDVCANIIKSVGLC